MRRRIERPEIIGPCIWKAGLNHIELPYVLHRAPSFLYFKRGVGQSGSNLAIDLCPNMVLLPRSLIHFNNLDAIADGLI